MLVGSVLGQFCFRKALLPSLVAGSLICFGDAAVKAAVIISAVESGSNVIFSYTGQLNLAGLGDPGSFDFSVLGFGSAVTPLAGSIISGGIYDTYQYSGAFIPFGSGGTSVFGSFSGNGHIAILNSSQSQEIWVPSGYVSGAQLSGSVTFAGNFNSLGLTQGSYVTALPNDTITMNIGAVPAPLPLLGLGAATAFSRKLRQRIALRRKREEVGDAG